jgi:hypothetical protein
MPNALARLKCKLQEQGVDLSLLTELEDEYTELVKKSDEFEVLLITIVRTGWPWDEEGKPNEIHAAVKGGFTEAMVTARNLLGLNLATMITRTEPKT